MATLPSQAFSAPELPAAVDEMHLLPSRLASAQELCSATETPGTVLLSGAPGAGKTSVLAWLAERLERDGRSTFALKEYQPVRPEHPIRADVIVADEAQALDPATVTKLMAQARTYGQSLVLAGAPALTDGLADRADAHVRVPPLHRAEAEDFIDDFLAGEGDGRIRASDDAAALLILHAGQSLSRLKHLAGTALFEALDDGADRIEQRHACAALEMFGVEGIPAAEPAPEAPAKSDEPADEAPLTAIVPLMATSAVQEEPADENSGTAQRRVLGGLAIAVPLAALAAIMVPGLADSERTAAPAETRAVNAAGAAPEISEDEAFVRLPSMGRTRENPAELLATQAPEVLNEPAAILPDVPDAPALRATERTAAEIADVSEPSPPRLAPTPRNVRPRAASAPAAPTEPRALPQQAAETAAPPPRISAIRYQADNKASRKRAERFAAALRGQGWVVGELRPVSAPLIQPSVRQFGAEETANAGGLAVWLRANLPGDLGAQPVYVNSLPATPTFQDGTIEIDMP